MPLDDYLLTDEKINSDFKTIRTIPGMHHILTYFTPCSGISMVKLEQSICFLGSNYSRKVFNCTFPEFPLAFLIKVYFAP